MHCDWLFILDILAIHLREKQNSFPFSKYVKSRNVASILFSSLIMINILSEITDCPHENERLAGENEFWRAPNHVASVLLLIGQYTVVRSFLTNHLSMRKPFESARFFHGDSTFKVHWI